MVSLPPVAIGVNIIRSSYPGIAGAILALLAPASQAAAPVAAPVDANAALDALFAAEAASLAERDPIAALEQGEAVTPAQFRRAASPALLADAAAHQRQLAAALARIDPATLDPAHRTSWATLANLTEAETRFADPPVARLAEALAMEAIGGLHQEFPALASAASAVPLDTLADHREMLTRDAAVGLVFADVIARLEAGKAARLTLPRREVRLLIGQIDAILARPPATSSFISPAEKANPDLSEAERDRLFALYLDVTRRVIYPAYRGLRRYLAHDYLPAARTSDGLGALPGGEALYRALLRRHTTRDIDPRDLHQLGLAEVMRIEAEMAQVEAELGDHRPLAQFFDAIRHDPRFHPRHAEELAAAYRAVAAQVTAALPRLFHTLPHTNLVIEAQPAWRARYEAGGSYAPGTADGARPGVFYFNTFDLSHRFLSGVTTLYLHEGAPGHHIQISLAEQNAALPDFQRFGGNTAFVEGWALYAETLGYDMGLYRDPLQHWGTLDDEMLRAMRLVVDTGIHALGWTRAQAMAWMLAHSGIGRTDAAFEVDRYIADPGQAVAYKIGALTIQHLRREAAAALGSRFDLAAFHDCVLGAGAIPLPVLEARVHAWITAQQNASDPH